MKGIAVLGSTGTIGLNSLKVISNYPEEFFVVSLSCKSNITELRKQIKAHMPRIVCISKESSLKDLKEEFPQVSFFSGEEGLRACIESNDVDIVIMGIVGFSALMPSIWTLKAKKTLAMANKETWVVAGNLLKQEQKDTCIIPVDSEHNAIFQLIDGRNRDEIESIILTASGGPFFRSKKDLSNVKPEEVLKHPIWNMGPKISVDSATMINKGMEIIEAHFLFDIPQERIQVLIHPQSIVHAMVELCDNSFIGQFSLPDMKGAISYALSYPKRLTKSISKLPFSNLKLEFFSSDEIPALKLARYALKEGQSFLIAFNAANEVAVENFLKNQIKYTDIIPTIEKILEHQKNIPITSIEDIICLDSEIRIKTHRLINSEI